MGKVKSRRQKFHAAAVKLKENEEKGSQAPMDTVTPLRGLGPLSVPALPQGQNPFSGMEIDMGKLEQGLPDLDARSTITSKTLKSSNLTKKDKRKIKHDYFIQKIDAIQASKRKAKSKKQVKKHPVVGNIQILADSLPTLDLLLKDCQKKKEEREKKLDRESKKSMPRMKTRKKRMLNDVSLFKQVLTHPAYKTNAKATMKEHLENWIKQQEHPSKT